MRKCLSVNELEPGMIAAEDIYIPSQTLALVFKETVLNDRIIRLIRQHDIYQVTVEIPDPPRPEDTPYLDEKVKAKAVNGIRNLFDTVSGGDTEENKTTAYQAVKEINDVVDTLVETISTETKSLMHISDLKSHDEYTYHHSLSVAVLSIAIGQSMKLSVPQVQILGRAAMMHDIGKIMIPSEVINKPSKLTDDEFKIIKNHPGLGYNHLEKLNVGDEDFRLAVLCHHEKTDGRGYPSGLSYNKIPLYARIISVADVYDAITSYRSYRSPMAPSEAIEMIMADVGKSFDYQIVRAFVKRLEMYPLKTHVELSDGRTGVVADNSHSMRPILIMDNDGSPLDLFDLENLNLVITKIIYGER